MKGTITHILLTSYRFSKHPITILTISAVAPFLTGLQFITNTFILTSAFMYHILSDIIESPHHQQQSQSLAIVSWFVIYNSGGEVNRRYTEESFSSTPIPHLIFHFIFISFSLISVVLSKQVPYRYHNKRKSPIKGLFTPFMKLCLIFKLGKLLLLQPLF